MEELSKKLDELVEKTMLSDRSDPIDQDSLADELSDTFSSSSNWISSTSKFVSSQAFSDHKNLTNKNWLKSNSAEKLDNKDRINQNFDEKGNFEDIELSNNVTTSISWSNNISKNDPLESFYNPTKASDKFLNIFYSFIKNVHHTSKENIHKKLKESGDLFFVNYDNEKLLETNENSKNSNNFESNAPQVVDSWAQSSAEIIFEHENMEYQDEKEIYTRNKVDWDYINHGNDSDTKHTNSVEYKRRVDN